MAASLKICLPFCHVHGHQSRPKRPGRDLDHQLIRASQQDAHVYDLAADPFEGQNDRVDATPLPLPPISETRTLTLVRHGQSSWNAAGRIQGSSDESVLTEKGRSQAFKAQQRLAGETFDALFASPLQRAQQTAEIIWSGRVGAQTVLPSLREIDLYSFQGLVKEDGKALYGNAYEAWKREPAAFEIDGHAPVRELWYRASLALQTILTTEPPPQHSLVVAHNAVNQALIAASLGLPPSAFRHLLQANAATTELRYMPLASGNASHNGGGTTAAAVLHMNQSPDVLTGLAASGPAPGMLRWLLVVCGTQGDTCSERSAARLTSQALAPFQVHAVVTDNTPAAQAFSSQLPDCDLQQQTWQVERADATGQDAAQQDAVCDAFRQVCSGDLLSAVATAGAALVLVTSSQRAAALLQGFCGISADRVDSAFELQAGGISCVDFEPQSDALLQQGIVHCINNRAHLFEDAAALPVGSAAASNRSDD